MEIDRWDVEAWAAKSRTGEVCGIFGCPNKPAIKCDHCGNYYCEEHNFALNTPGHNLKRREVDKEMTEWLDEPDREEFERAGLKCLILRHRELGHLCGYVAVPKGHPCYGKDFYHIPYDDLFRVEVHGGLTFAREGDGDMWQGGYWWLGFDCAHAWDIVPYMPLELPGTYKNFQYVRKETEDLADELETLDFIDWQFKWVWPLLLPVRTARRVWSAKEVAWRQEMMEEKVIPVLSKTIKTNKMPDISGFIQAMKAMGAKVSTKGGTIVINLRHSGGRR